MSRVPWCPGRQAADSDNRVLTVETVALGS